MSNTLVLNSNNVIGTNNSTFQYNFIQGAFRSKNCEMSIGSLTILTHGTMFHRSTITKHLVLLFLI